MVAMACGILIAQAAGSDAVVGTWQLNVAKSKFIAGPAIKSQTRTYSQSGNSITLEMKSVGADGTESDTHTTYEMNGKDFPITGNADFDALSGHKSSSRTATFNLKRGGKHVGSTTRTVSTDGKTMTTKTNLTNAKGERTQNVLVFDKQ
jgi:hypothetical protein